MDCICCGCTKAFLPQAFPGLAGDARIVDSSAGGFPWYLCSHVRDHWVGVAICLAIGCYLLQEHIRASGGFRNSFTQSHGISNTLGIILLLVFPIWALLAHVVWCCITASSLICLICLSLNYDLIILSVVNLLKELKFVDATFHFFFQIFNGGCLVKCALDKFCSINFNVMPGICIACLDLCALRNLQCFKSIFT